MSASTLAARSLAEMPVVVTPLASTLTVNAVSNGAADDGCPFAPRCRHVETRCSEAEPALAPHGSTMAACVVMTDPQRSAATINDSAHPEPVA